VMPHANKVQIKDAVEVAFNVRVRDVNTCNVHGKIRRFGRSRTVGRSWKKAIVTLEEGYKIELFEGI
jgi:large subunit ribosomal protein L23